MRYAVVVAGLLVALCTSGPAWGHGRSEPPKRVLIVVLDQLGRTWSTRSTCAT